MPSSFPNRSLPIIGGAFLLAVVVACSSGTPTPPVPTSAPTSSPTSVPTSSPTSAPTSSPTSAPTSSPTSAPTASPTSAPTASPSAGPTSSPVAATWTFTGSTANLAATNGQTPALVSLAAYKNITTTIQFGVVTAGSGTINVSDATNAGGDVAPNTLPADNATTGYTPIIYVSFYNAGTATISFGSNTPQISVTDSSGFGSATTCELDVYSTPNGGGSIAWQSIPASGTISGSSVTIATVSIAPETIDFKPGQQIVAVACK